ncbi:MAG: hypothetical protein WA306_04795 [Candidatus Acidiferrales bacterium]
MFMTKIVRTGIGFFGVILLTGAISVAVSAREQDKDDEDRLVEIGFKIAPVHLNLENKDHDLVGLGSFLVNAVAVCNDCHSPAGAMGPEEYLPGNNPYYGQKNVVNAAVYLSGNMDFGPIGPGSPDIISRNLTPDKTGLPEGGRSFLQGLTIMRTGRDFDLVHPPCTGAPDGTCLPAMDGDGNLLQIMRWRFYQNMTEHQLRAIYEYLSAVPCVEGPPAPSVLHNDCS